MSDRNERECRVCGSYLHHEDDCPKRSHADEGKGEDETQLGNIKEINEVKELDGLINTRLHHSDSDNEEYYRAIQRAFFKMIERLQSSLPPAAKNGEAAAKEYANGNGFKRFEDDEESGASNKWIRDAFKAGASWAQGLSSQYQRQQGTEGWIEVKEGDYSTYPEGKVAGDRGQYLSSDWVLVSRDGMSVDISLGMYDYHSKGWFDDMGSQPHNRVKYWMQVPEPPLPHKPIINQ